MSAYRTEPQVKLAYELERDDLHGAQAARTRRLVLRVLAPSIGVVLAVVSAILVLRLGPSVGLGGSALILALTVWLVRWSFGARQHAKLDAGWDDYRVQRLEASEDAFGIHDRAGGKRIAWELVVHWEEAPTAFHVYPTTGTFHVIPKRAFPSRAVEASFRQLLVTRVAPGGEAKFAAATRGAWIHFVVFVGIVVITLGAIVEALGLLLT